LVNPKPEVDKKQVEKKMRIIGPVFTNSSYLEYIIVVVIFPSTSKVLLKAASAEPKYFLAVVSLITTELGFSKAVAHRLSIVCC
jgi:hypothetical protein